MKLQELTKEEVKEWCQALDTHPSFNFLKKSIKKFMGAYVQLDPNDYSKVYKYSLDHDPVALFRSMTKMNTSSTLILRSLEYLDQRTDDHWDEIYEYLFSSHLPHPYIEGRCQWWLKHALRCDVNISDYQIQHYHLQEGEKLDLTPFMKTEHIRSRFKQLEESLAKNEPVEEPSIPLVMIVDENQKIWDRIVSRVESAEELDAIAKYEPECVYRYLAQLSDKVPTVPHEDKVFDEYLVGFPRLKKIHRRGFAILMMQSNYHTVVPHNKKVLLALLHHILSPECGKLMKLIESIDT